jgi:hypothetical protein
MPTSANSSTLAWESLSRRISASTLNPNLNQARAMRALEIQGRWDFPAEPHHGLGRTRLERIRRTGLALAFMTVSTACAPFMSERYGSASLPSDAVIGAGDPLRSTVVSVAMAFRSPGPLPAPVAARAIAQMEFLAANLPQSPTLRSSPPTLGPELDIARQEWRTTLGITPNAPAQSVINGLYVAGSALDAGQSEVALAALSRVPFQRGGPATLAQLAALPPLPHTAAAAAMAQQTLRDPSPSGRHRF